VAEWLENRYYLATKNISTFSNIAIINPDYFQRQ